MKPVKSFALCILVFTAFIFLFDWAQLHYYNGLESSPLIRVKSYVLIVTGVLIIKYTFSRQGGRIFIITYLVVWGCYFVFNYLFGHGVNPKLWTGIVKIYQEKIHLATPLPLIVFWLLDRFLFTEEKKDKEQ